MRNTTCIQYFIKYVQMPTNINISEMIYIKVRQHVCGMRERQRYYINRYRLIWWKLMFMSLTCLDYLPLDI